MHSYPKIYNLGHRQVKDILQGDVAVQEKVDGSQFSFGVTVESPTIPWCRSKNQDVQIAGEIEKIFRPAVETVVQLASVHALTPGWVYRGEAFAKPKHNTLAYDRVPAGNVILFDVDKGEEDFTSYLELSKIGDQLGLDVVPLVYSGRIASLEQVRAFLDRMSILGGSKIEGVVLKAYGRFGEDKKTLMAKYVSEAFKEVHQGEWKGANPNRADLVALMVEQYRTPARWAKAVQHLREAGTLTETPADIGPLMAEVFRDIETEEGEDIKARLYAHFKKGILKGAANGLPQWYKDQLAAAAFVGDAESIAPGDASGSAEGVHRGDGIHQQTETDSGVLRGDVAGGSGESVRAPVGVADPASLGEPEAHVASGTQQLEGA